MVIVMSEDVCYFSCSEVYFWLFAPSLFCSLPGIILQVLHFLVDWKYHQVKNDPNLHFPLTTTSLMTIIYQPGANAHPTVVYNDCFYLDIGAEGRWGHVHKAYELLSNIETFTLYVPTMLTMLVNN